MVVISISFTSKVVRSWVCPLSSYSRFSFCGEESTVDTTAFVLLGTVLTLSSILVTDKFVIGVSVREKPLIVSSAYGEMLKSTFFRGISGSLTDVEGLTRLGGVVVDVTSDGGPIGSNLD